MIPEKIITFTDKDFICSDEAKVYAGEYTMRRWNTGLKAKALDVSVELEAGGKKRMLAGTYQFATVAACLAKAPFKTSPNNPGRRFLEEMPPDINQRLYDIALSLNEQLPVKKREN